MVEEIDNFPLQLLSNSTWFLDEREKKIDKTLEFVERARRAPWICHNRKIVVVVLAIAQV
jgi:hypothetical protein